MSAAAPTALIAEDEPLLAAALCAELHALWPALQVLATVGDGESACAQGLALQPDVLFFDIRMPGMSGLEAAAALADAWDTAPGAKPFPALVFVTAYDQYAVAAFEAQALDYVLKPVQTQRLQKTVAKLQAALAPPTHPSTQLATASTAAAQHFETTLAQLRALLATTPANTAPAAPLTRIQASVGNAIHMVPIEDVLYFEAADKYLRVLTPEREYLIRTPLKDLLPQLDPHTFWQIHRGTVVRASTIAAVHRDEAGKASLSLRARPERLAISRLYAHLFRAM